MHEENTELGLMEPWRSRRVAAFLDSLDMMATEDLIDLRRRAYNREPPFSGLGAPPEFYEAVCFFVEHVIASRIEIDAAGD